MFVYREEYYVERTKPQEGTPEFQDWMAKMQLVSGKAEVIIGKQRHGPVGTVDAAVRGQRHALLRSGARRLHAREDALTETTTATTETPRASAFRDPVVGARRPHRRSGGAARQLGAPQRGLGPRGVRRRPQGRRLRARARAHRPRAHQRGLQDLLRRHRRRGPHRARGAAGRHRLRARRPAAGRRGALRGLRSAPGALQPRRGARLGRLQPRARAQARRRHPRRHRHEPARHARDRVASARRRAGPAGHLRDARWS